MPIACLFDDFRNDTECCATAVYDVMHRVYFYATDYNILSHIGYPRLRLAEALICRDEIHHGQNVLLISVQVLIGSYSDISRGE
jgi:hypothetical protein